MINSFQNCNLNNWSICPTVQHSPFFWACFIVELYYEFVIPIMSLFLHSSGAIFLCNFYIYIYVLEGWAVRFWTERSS